MKSSPELLTKKHQKLIHSDGLKVESHVQREDGEWILHTLMLEGVSDPFKFKRKGKYRSLKGQRVNLTYYRDSEEVAGFKLDIMRVVRIKIS